MTTRRTGWVIAGILVAGLMALPSRAEVDAEAGKANVNQKLIEAATKALEATEATFNVGRSSIEEVYVWSIRLVEARRYSRDSVKQHLERMTELHERTAALNRVGGEGGEAKTLHAAQYYLAEAEQLAELWAE